MRACGQCRAAVAATVKRQQKVKRPLLLLNTGICLGETRVLQCSVCHECYTVHRLCQLCQLCRLCSLRLVHLVYSVYQNFWGRFFWGVDFFGKAMPSKSELQKRVEA